MSPTGVKPWRGVVATFAPDFWRHRRLLSAAYACRAAAVVAAVLAPWPLKFVIDRVVAGHAALTVAGMTLAAAPAVAALTVAFLALAVVGALAGAAEKNMSATIRERLTFELRDRLMVYLLTLPPTLRTRHRSGELVLRIVDDTDLFVRVLTKTVPLVFQHGLTLAGTLAMMAWVDPRVALAGCGFLPIFGAVLRRDGRRLWQASRDKRVREGDVCGLTQEIVRGMAVIQASGTEQPTRDTFSLVNRRRVQAGREETAVAVSLEKKLQIVQGLAMAIVTAGGAWLVLRRQITVGDLTLLTVYVGQLLRPIEKLNDLAETTGRGLAGGERLLRLFEQQPVVFDDPGAREVTTTHGIVELRDVWFSYPDRSRPVLCGVNLRLLPGSLTALVGASGAGKSTLFSLLVRIFDPARGEIRLDGRPLPTLRLRSLREQFAVLSQETHLFAGSIRQALQPAARSASDEDVWSALRLVSLDEFVRSLPEQLDAVLGEDGVNLSGGQRRRLALARAFLLRRPILLLDEPLANIDAESAAVILTALERIRHTCTCVAITHESALVDRADRVYRLESGHIVETPRLRLAAGLGVQ